ncbi:F-box-like domain-containing protein [Rhizoctonia solani]|uniref:F-box-like domain-containing protein n=1 Tax=Rhizoctonia solani TaxID=456999 RepID=A0A8H8NPJ3_9AGAM|nr:F-box-like domain-containing protein [Rhizoctonia solani]QRW16116.1 F-box-like domain-containing protein [Rhizoctonia solani]
MSQKALPTELIQCIAEYLSDSFTLASLCLVDKQTLSVVHPSYILGRYVKAVHFDPPNPTDVAFYSLIEQIHLALHKTHNLKDLSLHIDSPNTIILFRGGWAPFALRRLACYRTMQPQFLFDFMSSQDTIQQLTIYESVLATNILQSQSVTCHGKFSRISPLSAPTRSQSTTSSPTDPSRESIQTMQYLYPQRLILSAKHSSLAPLPKAYNLSRDLEGVCKGSLREMTLTMPELSVGMLNLHEYTPLVEVLAASLEGFMSLEHFEFKDKGIEIITPDILLEGLGDVGTLAFWQVQIKSLKSVKLFGVKLI